MDSDTVGCKQAPERPWWGRECYHERGSYTDLKPESKEFIECQRSLDSVYIVRRKLLYKMVHDFLDRQ